MSAKLHNGDSFINALAEPIFKMVLCKTIKHCLQAVHRKGSSSDIEPLQLNVCQV